MPALDYTSLMALSWQLTRQTAEVLRMFTLMCFNVFSHNRDDHAKNFTFICDGGTWSLSPAYDLTYSNSIGGEHATTIAGEGRNPGMSDVLAVAERAGIRESQARETAENVRERVNAMLRRYMK